MERILAEQLRRSKEKSQERAPDPSSGTILAWILNDKKSSHLFGRLLEISGQDALASRIVEGKLVEGDINLLDEYRLKYLEKINQSERVERLLTEEIITEIARNHPDFEKIFNLVGPQKAISAIRSQLKEICITDESRFREIAGPIEEHDGYIKGTYKNTSDKVEEMLKVNGISKKEYLAALAIDDPKEKEVALKKLAKGQHGKWETAWRVLSIKNIRVLKDLKVSEVKLESSFAELDEYKKDIGTMLFLSVSGNDDMRNALYGELLPGGEQAAEPKIGLMDAQRGGFDEKRFDSAWEAYKKTEKYSEHDEGVRDEIKDRFIEEQREQYIERNKGKKGFWASIVASLFEGMISNKREELS